MNSAAIKKAILLLKEKITRIKEDNFVEKKYISLPYFICCFFMNIYFYYRMIK